SARNLFPPLHNPELTIRRRSRVDPTLLNYFKMATEGNGDPPVPDLQTMKELCQPTLNGRGRPIAPIAIQATNFGLKNDMIQQVQIFYQFHGITGDDANKHLDKFLHVTQSIKVNGVIDEALRLYLFPHSLTHHATAWFDRLPRNYINTFEKMAKMFLGKYFPPSMVTKLINEITNFRQRPDELLFEAWERYKLSIDRCPNHNMLPVTQIDTFYNGLILIHHDTINAAGGTFMKRSPEELTNKSKQLLLTMKLAVVLILTMIVQRPLAKLRMYMLWEPIIKVVILTSLKNFQNQNRNQGNNHPWGNNQGRHQFFQGASHGQNPPPAYQAPAYQAPAYQAPGYQAPVRQPSIPQPQVVTTTDFTNYMKENDAILKNMQTNMTSLTNSNLELKNMFGQFMKMNIASSSGLGTLLSNTVTNPKEDLKGITTRRGNAYQGPTIPTTSSSLPQVVKRETEVTKDTPVVAPVSAPKPNPKPSIPYPSRLHDQKLRDKTNDQKRENFPNFNDLDFNISFADALILLPMFGPTIKSLLTNKDKLFELARTLLNAHCSTVLLKKLPKKLEDPDKFPIPCDFPGMDECFALADLDASINLMSLSVWNKISLPELTLTLTTLKLAGWSISRPIGVAKDVFVKVGKFHFPVDFVVVDFDAHSRVPLILGRSFLKIWRALIDVYAGELTLRVNSEAVTFNLDQTSRYSANYNRMANRIDVIDMAYEEYY
nr:reverse transcriptase domain-containing protein [Tanacetum cinerariifolium]